MKYLIPFNPRLEFIIIIVFIAYCCSQTPNEEIPNEPQGFTSMEESPQQKMQRLVETFRGMRFPEAKTETTQQKMEKWMAAYHRNLAAEENEKAKKLQALEAKAVWSFIVGIMIVVAAAFYLGCRYTLDRVRGDADTVETIVVSRNNNTPSTTGELIHMSTASRAPREEYLQIASGTNCSGEYEEQPPTYNEAMGRVISDGTMPPSYSQVMQFENVQN